MLSKLENVSMGEKLVSCVSIDLYITTYRVSGIEKIALIYDQK